MKKIEIIELIEHMLVGGDSTPETQGKFHPSVIDAAIESVYTPHLWELATISHNSRDESVLNHYAKEFTEEVLQEESGQKRFYINITPPLAALPRLQSIRLVYPYECINAPYIYRDSRANSIYEGTDVQTVDDTPRWNLLHDKIYFPNMKKLQKPEKVVLQLCCAWGAFEDHDEIPIPGGKDNILIQMVIAELSGTKYTTEDKQVNNEVDAQLNGGANQ